MIEVKDDWCKGCNICIDRCPVDALEESDKLNKRGIRPPKLKEKNDFFVINIWAITFAF